jgi:hypothetical protein
LRYLVAVLADFASLSDDGKLNIMGIFHEINAPSLPFPLPQIYLVFSLEAEPAEYGEERMIRIVLRHDGAADNEILDFQGSVRIPQPERPGRVITNQLIGLSGVNLERVGNYTFSINVGEEEVATVRMRVKVVENELTGGS